MKYIGAYEAKTHFSELMERVAKGERIVITRRGEPVMTWEPAKKKPKMSSEEVMRRMAALREKCPKDNLSVREMIEEGRRY